jgi:hypothetical protein
VIGDEVSAIGCDKPGAIANIDQDSVTGLLLAGIGVFAPFRVCHAG